MQRYTLKWYKLCYRGLLFSVRLTTPNKVPNGGKTRFTKERRTGLWEYSAKDLREGGMRFKEKEERKARRVRDGTGSFQILFSSYSECTAYSELA